MEYEVRSTGHGLLARLLGNTYELFAVGHDLRLATIKLELASTATKRFVEIWGDSADSLLEGHFQTDPFGVGTAQYFYNSYSVSQAQDPRQKQCLVLPTSRTSLATSPIDETQRGFPVFFCLEEAGCRHLIAADRKTEIAQLHRAWEDSDTGRGQIGSLKFLVPMESGILRAAVLASIVEILRDHCNQGVVISRV